MKHICDTLHLCVITVVGMLMSSACGTTTPTQYYQLSAASDNAGIPQAESKKATILVGIGPVEVPAYVDRDNMVLHVNKAELELLEFDRWAEPLSHNLSRVLVENVSRHLAHQGVTVVRWDDGLPVNYRLQVEFTRFDLMREGNVSLVARWILFATESQETLAIQTSRFSGSGNPHDYGSLVSEMSRHVESLSREMAETLSKTF